MVWVFSNFDEQCHCIIIVMWRLHGVSKINISDKNAIQMYNLFILFIIASYTRYKKNTHADTNRDESQWQPRNVMCSKDVLVMFPCEQPHSELERMVSVSVLCYEIATILRGVEHCHYECTPHCKCVYVLRKNTRCSRRYGSWTRVLSARLRSGVKQAYATSDNHNKLFIAIFY